MNVDIAGETLQLLSERAVYWVRMQTLLVADAHFGKAAAFRTHGVYVPEGTTTGALARLDGMLESTGATRIVFLGDLLHAREGVRPDVVATIAMWRTKRSSVTMTLVRGNHDKHAGDPPAELDITCCDAPLLDPPFAFCHVPCDVDGHYVLAGHVHPCVMLTGPARQRDCLPCFWFGKRRGVLPAFGEFTGLAPVQPDVDDQILVTTDDGVLPAAVAQRPSANSTGRITQRNAARRR